MELYPKGSSEVRRSPDGCGMFRLELAMPGLGLVQSDPASLTCALMLTAQDKKSEDWAPCQFKEWSTGCISVFLSCWVQKQIGALCNGLLHCGRETELRELA